MSFVVYILKKKKEKKQELISWDDMVKWKISFLLSAKL